MARERLNLNGTIVDTVVQMSEGNPGAATVLARILKSQDTIDGLTLILNLDDMNMRGPQIWLGYKDHCDKNLSAFIECIRSRDPMMIATVNANRGMIESGGELAVERGGSNR